MSKKLKLRTSIHSVYRGFFCRGDLRFQDLYLISGVQSLKTWIQSKQPNNLSPPFVFWMNKSPKMFDHNFRQHPPWPCATEVVCSWSCQTSGLLLPWRRCRAVTPAHGIKCLGVTPRMLTQLQNACLTAGTSLPATFFQSASFSMSYRPGSCLAISPKKQEELRWNNRGTSTWCSNRPWFDCKTRWAR